MRKASLYKDISRTLTNNISRFIAITMMIALGIGVFSGFAAGCLDTLKSADSFYDAQNTYDIKIESTLGLNDDDISAAAGVDGMLAVFGGRSLDVKVELTAGNLKPATLNTLDANGMNKPYVLEGRLPTKSGQIAVNSKFVEDTGLHVGDVITLTTDDTAGKAAATEETSSETTIDNDSKTPALAVKEYEITAIILSPLYISAEKITSSSSGSNYMMYAMADCISGAVYSAIYLTVDGASELDCYSKEYKTLMDDMTAKIKATIQENRQQARYDEVAGDANAKIAKTEKQLADKEVEAQQKFSDAQAEIDDGWAKLNAGKAALDSQKADASEQFSTNEQLIAQSRDTLDKQRSETDAQFAGAVSALSADAQQIWNSEATQQVWAAMTADGVKAAPYLLAVKQGDTPTQEQTDTYNAAMAALQTDTQAFSACFNSDGSYLSEEQITAFSNFAVAYGTYNYSQTQLEENSAALAAQKTDALGQFSDATQKLAESESKLIDGQAELDKNKSDYEDSIAEVQQKLTDAKNEVSEIHRAEWYVWDRLDNDSCAGLNSDVSFIKAVTTAFPIIFFLVAVLISLTTMTRMVEEDRGLIGTYKSLGYSNRKISLKYILYAVLACVFGDILGNVIGFIALPKAVGIIMSNIYVLPMFRLSCYPGYALGGFGLFLVGILGATAISCAEMLRERPAELMRPKAPKAGNRILLERMPFIWKRLNFLSKVTCRNLFRYKKRAIMTIVGILGCTMLIMFGFGIRNTVGGLMSDQYDTVTTYDAIVVTDNLNTAGMDTLAEEWNASEMVKDDLQLQISSLTLRGESESCNITVLVIPDGADLEPYIHLQDSVTGKAMSMPATGIAVTQNAAKKLGLTSGDIVSLQNDDNLEHNFPVEFVATNYAGNYVLISESCYQATFGDYAGTSFLMNLTDNSNGQKWLDQLRDDDRILSVSSSQATIDSFGDVSQIVDMVVYILISMSAVLALTVLFTLSNINISERDRELATIKVLGFQRKEVYDYVNKETLILSIIGILLGLPAGYGITYGILASVNIAEVAFRVRVSASAYLIAAVLTLIFVLLINVITNKGLRRINMVEALKSVE